jgi:hypothetical protein
MIIETLEFGKMNDNEFPSRSSHLSLSEPLIRISFWIKHDEVTSASLQLMQRPSALIITSGQQLSDESTISTKSLWRRASDEPVAGRMQSRSSGIGGCVENSRSTQLRKQRPWMFGNATKRTRRSTRSCRCSCSRHQLTSPLI